MTCDIVIRSWKNDFEFLKYCLRSIQRFATGFRHVVVIVPEGQVPPTGTAERVFYVREYGDGYMQQQVDKLRADAFTDAEFLTYMDSDTIFVRPVRPENLIDDQRRPIWLYTPYASLGNDDSQLWKSITARVIGQPVEQEYMRRHPLTVRRSMLEQFRQWMLRTHGESLERYIMRQPGHEFSEWNALGAYLWFHQPASVVWQNTDVDIGTCYVHQSYSWNGLNPDLQKHLEAAVA